MGRNGGENEVWYEMVVERIAGNKMVMKKMYKMKWRRKKTKKRALVVLTNIPIVIPQRKDVISVKIVL
jgi:hypothetical protein